MSTDSQAGVEVKSARNTNTYFYQGANQIGVVEGHLHVRMGQEVVAIHAPGEWGRAKVNR